MKTQAPASYIWAIDEHAFKQFCNNMTAGPVDDMNRAGLPIRRIGSTAIIDVSGPIMRRDSAFVRRFGFASSDVTAATISGAAIDDDVEMIILHIDSPGGEVDGMVELADAVHAAAGLKPVIAQIEGMAASAAFWLASQANIIRAGRLDLIGSIGVRMALIDMSEAAAKDGIKVIPIDTGEFKSAGLAGIKITEAQIEQFQKIVDETFAVFKEHILRGRNDMTVDDLDPIADGRVFHAEEALQLGLIDEIGGFAEALMFATHHNDKKKRSFVGGNMNTAIGDTRLSTLLTRAIDDEVTEDRTRGDVMAAMARAAGIDVTTVEAIVNAAIMCPPLRRLNGFARVLRPTLTQMRSAAEADGCEYGEDGEVITCPNKTLSKSVAKAKIELAKRS